MKRVALFCLFLSCVLVFASVPASAKAQVIYKHAGSGESKRVALTFDDGPHPRYTPQILEILAEYGVEATFFAVGMNAETYPTLITREIAEGHEVGNHTYNHYHTANLDAATFEKDILACSETLTKITGQKPRLFRPPEGVCTESAKALCERENYTIILWSVDTRDWAHTPVSEICRNVRENTKDGSIILMHDFIGKNSPTPEALRKIIPMLQESGFEFVTVSKLLQS